MSDFNPRVPCGTRPIRQTTKTVNGYFNPRVPCGTRHINGSWRTNAKSFQPTRPLRDATRYQILKFLPRNDFNPRVPCGTRRAMHSSTGGVQECISTHASLAGRDTFIHLRPFAQRYFNPRVPCGTRRWRKTKNLSTCAISTHASLAGRDS